MHSRSPSLPSAYVSMGSMPLQPAYIISAYKRVDLLMRLVRALGGAPIAIHVDLKSDIFEDVRSALHGFPNVALLPRHTCHWGLFGHVKASLEGMQWFLDTDADYAILLTGQCYPLKSQDEIRLDVAALAGRSVIEHAPFPKADWQVDNGGWDRIDRYYFPLRPNRSRGYWRLDPWLLRFASGVRLLRLKPWRRQVPGKLHPYGGSGYWCLSRACVEHVIRFIGGHPAFCRFFASTYVPDEIFFQTILANGPLQDTLINAPIHYLNWSGGRESPAVITADAVPKAFASGAWFARKFDDPAVLDLVDQWRETASLTPVPWSDCLV